MPTQAEVLKKLNDSESLTDVLIQFENFLDDLDLYVFKNWVDGEVYSGPKIDRYWVKVVLRYDYDNMPDPAGGLRLLKHGAKVQYQKTKIKEPQKITNPSDYRPGHPGKPKIAPELFWLVTIEIPRKFIKELSDSDIDMYDDNEDDVNVEAASDARDEGLDLEDVYRGD